MTSDSRDVASPQSAVAPIAKADSTAPPTRVMVIGSSSHFISGISHYTHAFSRALAETSRTSVILMRRLIPRRLYPGADRVGADIARLEYPDDVRVHDGVDYFWLPSIFGALKLLWQERPEAVVVQWWTVSVAHTYLVLVALARLRGASIIFEMHEVQDTGEVSLPFVATYSRLIMRFLIPMIDGFVIHSEADRSLLTSAYPVGERPIVVVRHGPFEQYRDSPAGPLREAPSDVTNLMFFGTIRPYKGLEDLVRAFDSLDEPQRFWLTVVGETWEGWTSPSELIEASPNRARITFVNRYVTDAEASRWLAGADALVLPYLRSSASGPLHVGMALGLPIAVSDVPALVDAASGYTGCRFFTPQDIEALRDALIDVAARRGTVYQDPASWHDTAETIQQLITTLRSARSR